MCVRINIQDTCPFIPLFYIHIYVCELYIYIYILYVCVSDFLCLFVKMCSIHVCFSRFQVVHKNPWITSVYQVMWSMAWRWAEGSMTAEQNLMQMIKTQVHKRLRARIQRKSHANKYDLHEACIHKRCSNKMLRLQWSQTYCTCLFWFNLHSQEECPIFKEWLRNRCWRTAWRIGLPGLIRSKVPLAKLMWLPRLPVTV